MRDTCREVEHGAMIAAVGCRRVSGVWSGVAAIDAPAGQGSRHVVAGLRLRNGERSDDCRAAPKQNDKNRYGAETTGEGRRRTIRVMFHPVAKGPI
jgi:hypothetical protein